MTSRATKLLLTLIAGGLWGLLLRPAMTPEAATSQPQPLTAPALAATGDVSSGYFVFLAESGHLSVFAYDSVTGKFSLKGRVRVRQIWGR